MMKAITHKGIYSPIVKNNGVSITIVVAKGPAKGSTQVLNYSEFSERQQKMLTRNKTHTDYHMVKNAMNGAMVSEAVDTPYSCSAASEAYWSS